MITYEIAKSFDVEKIIEVFESSGIVRPTKEKERIKSMFENANLVYFAYDNGELIGLARCVTDFSYCCYLSDLAVKKDYQKQGIGKMLIKSRTINLCSIQNILYGHGVKAFFCQ